MSLWTVAVLVFVLTLLAAFVGSVVGHRLRAGITDAERTQLYGMQASLLGMLALLLGFSFAMGETRFDMRKQFLIEETNAIGTAWLRAGVVDDDRARELQHILAQYVSLRLATYRARDARAMQQGLADSERLHREAWARVTALARAQPHSLPVSLLMQAVNDVIDCHTKRIAAERNHIPTAVLISLIVVAMVSMGWVGAGLGLGTRQGTATIVFLSALLSLLVGVVVDLDQPRFGLIRISQAILVDLERSMH